MMKLQFYIKASKIEPRHANGQ